MTGHQDHCDPRATGGCACQPEPAPAERQAALRAALDTALRTTPSTGNAHKPGEEKWDHHPKPGEHGHIRYTCALCGGDIDALVPALLAAVERVMQPELDRDEARAALERVRQWIAGDPVTAKTPFGDGYREALRDISDLLDHAERRSLPSSGTCGRSTAPPESLLG